MNRFTISILLTPLVSLCTTVWAGEMDALDSGETNKVWQQTDWSGRGYVEFIEEGDIGAFRGYYQEESSMLPEGDIEVGVYQLYINIFEEHRDSGYANVNDIVLSTIGII
ncbi:MAG: hypothetical protein GY771_06285, partial [bacterium]|nr:hypothetical protein [bacterium]